MEIFGYIYKTTNKINGKIYIGKRHSEIFIEDYFGSGKLIKRAINKYGVENFTVEMIDTARNLDELNSKEIYHIAKMDSQNLEHGYNIAPGGDGGAIIKQLPPEQYAKFVKKCRVNAKGKNNPNYGNGDKIRGDKNPAKRPSVRAKISKAVSGKKNGMYGKKHTKESMEQKRKNHLKNHGFFVNGSTKYEKNWRVLILPNGQRYIYRSKSSVIENSIKIFGTAKRIMTYAYEMAKQQGYYNISHGVKDVEVGWVSKKHRQFLSKYPNAILYDYNYLKKENPELICNCKEIQTM